MEFGFFCLIDHSERQSLQLCFVEVLHSFAMILFLSQLLDFLFSPKPVYRNYRHYLSWESVC